MLSSVASAPVASGAFSEVFPAKLKPGQAVAVKRCKPSAPPAAAAAYIKELFAEAALLHQAQSHSEPSHVVCRCIGLVVDGPMAPAAVLEWCAGGTLDDASFGEGSEAVPYVARVRAAANLCRNVALLHAAGVAHRDLKPDNVMLTGPLSEDSSKCLLVDLGLAADLGDAEANNQYSATKAFKTFCPPEMATLAVGSAGVLRRRYGFEGDAYALGLTMYEVVAQRRVFVRPLAPVEEVRRPTRREKHQARAQMVLTDPGEPLSMHATGAGWPPEVSLEVKDIVNELLERDPSRRLAPSDAARRMEAALAEARKDSTRSTGALAASRNPTVRMIRFLFKAALMLPTMVLAWAGMLVCISSVATDTPIAISSAVPCNGTALGLNATSCSAVVSGAGCFVFPSGAIPELATSEAGVRCAEVEGGIDAIGPVLSLLQGLVIFASVLVAGGTSLSWLMAAFESSPDDASRWCFCASPFKILVPLRSAGTSLDPNVSKWYIAFKALLALGMEGATLVTWWAVVAPAYAAQVAANAAVVVALPGSGITSDSVAASFDSSSHALIAGAALSAIPGALAVFTVLRRRFGGGWVWAHIGFVSHLLSWAGGSVFALFLLVIAWPWSTFAADDFVQLAALGSLLALCAFVRLGTEFMYGLNLFLSTPTPDPKKCFARAVSYIGDEPIPTTLEPPSIWSWPNTPEWLLTGPGMGLRVALSAPLLWPWLGVGFLFAPGFQLPMTLVLLSGGAIASGASFVTCVTHITIALAGPGSAHLPIEATAPTVAALVLGTLILFPVDWVRHNAWITRILSCLGRNVPGHASNLLKASRCVGLCMSILGLILLGLQPQGLSYADSSGA